MDYEYLLLAALTTACVIVQSLTIYTLVKIERTKILGRTIAWKLIGMAFVLFLLKWTYVAALIYYYRVSNYYTIIHEAITLIAALLLFIGFRIVLSNLKKTMKFLKWFTKDTPSDLPMKVIEKPK